MYERLDEAQLAAFGLTKADFEQIPVEIWPEHDEAWRVFCGMCTQWRVGGMGGYIGLDYSVLYRKLDRMDLDPARYDELEFEVCVIEGAALEELNKRDERPDP